MVFAGLRRDAEVGAEKRRADFGYEFFHGIARIAEALPAEIPMQTGGVTRPVRYFMGEGGVIALRVAEGLKLRHLHQVISDDGGRSWSRPLSSRAISRETGRGVA